MSEGGRERTRELLQLGARRDTKRRFRDAAATLQRRVSGPSRVSKRLQFDGRVACAASPKSSVLILLFHQMHKFLSSCEFDKAVRPANPTLPGRRCRQRRRTRNNDVWRLLLVHSRSGVSLNKFQSFPLFLSQHQTLHHERVPSRTLSISFHKSCHTLTHFFLISKRSVCLSVNTSRSIDWRGSNFAPRPDAQREAEAGARTRVAAAPSSRCGCWVLLHQTCSLLWALSPLTFWS